jgi:hypothetical protein
MADILGLKLFNLQMRSDTPIFCFMKRIRLVFWIIVMIYKNIVTNYYISEIFLKNFGMTEFFLNHENDSTY